MTTPNILGSASRPTTKPGSRSARQSSDGNLQRDADQAASASPSKPQGKSSFEDPIVLSDTTDTDHDVEEIMDSSDDDVTTAPTALTPSPNVPKQNASLLPPSFVANNLIERSHSASSLDQSYATSLNSDLNAISDGSLSSLSSVDDSDSDGSEAATKSDAGIKTPKRLSRSSQNANRLATTPTKRASEEAQEAASSSTSTPSRRSARIVSSGSIIQKALQRRDELDAKLTASPIRRKPISPEAPPPKRPRGRPRKSAPDATLADSTNVRMTTPRTAASSSLQTAPPSTAARRSSRLSLPATVATAAADSSSQVTAASHSPRTPKLEQQEARRGTRQGRRSQALEVTAETRIASRSSSTPSVRTSDVASPAASPGLIPTAKAGSGAANGVDQDAPVIPVKRGPGRPRKSQSVVLPSPLASGSSAAQVTPKAMTTRLRKRSLSSAGPSATPKPSSVARKEEHETPRRKRGRPARSLLGLENDMIATTSATPTTAAEADDLSRQQAIDLLDDDLSELSDDSEMSFDSPEPSQSGSQPRQSGAARRGRPPLARSAEARKIKRASRQDKDGKAYHFSGLYAGEADAVASTSRLNQGAPQNTVFPTAIHFGAKLLTEERDFCLPFPIHQKMDELRARVNAKRKPPRYQQISKNKYYSRPKLQGEVPLCNCKPGSGCGTDCLNRMLMFICDPKTCPSASNCTNVSLGRRPTVKTAVAYYGRRGFGLKTLEPIKKDEFIDEYRGEVIDLFEAKKRVTDEYKATGNFYLLDYDSAAGELLDGGRKGNITRFANHSCDPNCRIEKFIICGTDEALSAEFQIGLFATRDIEAGEELTYNYGWSAFQPRDITGAPTAQVAAEQCLCGAANCSGILGGKKAPATKPAPAVVAANSRKKTAKGKGKGRKAGKASRVRMRSMTPLLNASRLSAAAMPSSTLKTTTRGRTARKLDESQSSLLSKIVIKRRERSARAANEASASGSFAAASTPTVATTAESSTSAVDTMDVDEQLVAETYLPQHRSATPRNSSSSNPTATTSSAQTATTASAQQAPAVGASTVEAAQASGSADVEGNATTASSSSGKSSSTAASKVLPRLPLLNRLATTRLGSAFGRAATVARGTKDRRWSAAEALASDNDESSSLERDLSDSDGLISDFQKQDDGPQQHPASKKAAGKPGRRGRHKLQLSREEAERRAAERRARNAFLARVRRASKRGIVIEDPTQHPLKKISIQCTAAPENTYIPDLPSSLVTLGMTTADARRARNAFLARVRRAVKRGYAKDVAIKMAAKPLPGDTARDTPVMKAQRAYMEQLEREAADELAGSAGPSTQGMAQNSEGSRTNASSQSAAADTEDGWVDESSWAVAQ